MKSSCQIFYLVEYPRPEERADLCKYESLIAIYLSSSDKWLSLRERLPFCGRTLAVPAGRAVGWGALMGLARSRRRAVGQSALSFEDFAPLACFGVRRSSPEARLLAGFAADATWRAFIPGW